MYANAPAKVVLTSFLVVAAIHSRCSNGSGEHSAVAHAKSELNRVREVTLTALQRQVTKKRTQGPTNKKVSLSVPHESMRTHG